MKDRVNAAKGEVRTGRQVRVVAASNEDVASDLYRRANVSIRFWAVVGRANYFARDGVILLGLV